MLLLNIIGLSLLLIILTSLLITNRRGSGLLIDYKYILIKIFAFVLGVAALLLSVHIAKGNTLACVPVIMGQTGINELC